MKNKFKWLSVLMIMTLLLTFIPLTAMAKPPSKPAPKTTTINYIALGDSIAYGYGGNFNFFDQTLFTGYDDYFAAFLRNQGKTVYLKNYAVNGNDSSEFLTQLKTNSGVRSAIKGANLITISMGGNNILDAEINNYADIDTVKAQAGVERFLADWPQILDEIRSIKRIKAGQPIPNLYVMTIYNPYSMATELSLFGKANTYIEEINTKIRYDSNGDSTYTVADVYKHFLANNPFMNQWTHFFENTRDPHPTDEGFRQISSVHQGVYK